MGSTSQFDIWQIIERIAYGLLLTIVVLVPLPLGSNTPMAMMVLAGLSGLVLALTSAVLLRHPETLEDLRPGYLQLAMGAFAAFGLWCVIQTVPGLPGALPHPLWSEAANILGVSPRKGTISLDPEATWFALAKTFGYAALGISAFVLLRKSARRRTALAILATASGLYAFYGLAAWTSGDCCVLWYPKTDYQGVVTGPFINRNSFATYLGLGALTCLGLILREIGELRHVSTGSAARQFWVRATLFLVRRGLYLAAFLVLSAALLFTSSRAGISAVLLGGVVLVFLASQAGLFGRGRKLLHLFSFLAIAGVAIAVFGGSFLARFENDGVEDAYRAQSWKVIVSGIETSPFLGHGFGTFPEAFPLYRDDRLPSRRFWDKAHNTYLELVLDTGIPATAVFLLGFAGLCAQCFKGLGRGYRERRIFPAIGLAATVQVGAHSLIDFSMQIPAVAATYMVIIAIALTESGVWSQKDQSSVSGS